MKNLFLVISISVFLLSSCSDDGGSANDPNDGSGSTHWIEQNSGVTGQLRDIFFLNANEGWICGVNGTILHTTNGGDVWRPQNSGTTLHLIAIHFTDPLNGYAAGVNGLILKTNDGGNTWTRLPMNSLYTYWGVYFITPAKGFFVGIYDREGCVITATTDSGKTWDFTYYRRGELLYNFRDVDFVDSQHGCIIGYNKWFLTTSDGGTTWVDKSDKVPSGDIYGIDFISPNIAFASDFNGKIHKTTDNGDSWTEIHSVVRAYRDVGFVNESTGWAAGSQGNIIFTNDGGKTWTEQRGLTEQSCEGMFVLDAANAWIIYSDSKILKYKP
jgi:photosystem II stability/assembly factor-like uncharacterized protein